MQPFTHSHILESAFDLVREVEGKTGDRAYAMSLGVQAVLCGLPATVMAQADSAGMGEMLPAKPVLEKLVEAIQERSEIVA